MANDRPVLQNLRTEPPPNATPPLCKGLFVCCEVEALGSPTAVVPLLDASPIVVVFFPLENHLLLGLLHLTLATTWSFSNGLHCEYGAGQLW